MAILDFMYDDNAPGPGEQLKNAFDKAASCAGRAMQTPAASNMKAGASFGLKVGAFLGTIILVTGVCHGVIDAVFGRD